MLSSFFLRPLQRSDHVAVREVYSNAIEFQGDNFYTTDQIRAWSSLAWLPGVLDKPLSEGMGWISFEDKDIAAFAVRYPLDRLALLYCRSCYSRRGHATALIRRIEFDALNEGQFCLFTEASLLSYPLLIKCGWEFKSNETVLIGGISFDRYRMEKLLI